MGGTFHIIKPVLSARFYLRGDSGPHRVTLGPPIGNCRRRGGCSGAGRRRHAAIGYTEYRPGAIDLARGASGRPVRRRLWPSRGLQRPALPPLTDPRWQPMRVNPYGYHRPYRAWWGWRHRRWGW
jgi:hypothetical protein